VRLAERREDSHQVVAKFIHSTNVWHWHNETKDIKIPLEIWMMKTFLGLRLHQVIQYYDHYQIGNRFIIIMEYLGDNWTDLYDFIEQHGPLNESMARAIFRSVVEILQKMHSLGYSHNDIKGP
jgi:serine/threonine protein kinase